MADTGVKVTIKDASGVDLGSFIAQEWKTIAQMAEENNIDIPVSCGAGACFVCAVKVISGKEFLIQDMISPSLVDLEEDQFLTCIWGVDPKFINDWDSHEIVLEKIL